MLLYYKNRFPGPPEAIGTISKPFWVISGKICFLICVDHFWDQLRPSWTKSDHLGPISDHIGPILDLFLTNYGTKSPTTWVLDMLEIGHNMILGTRHAGDWP